MSFVKLLMLIGFTSIFLSLESDANACSWASPEGMTSQWVEDKVVFWGRAVETKWNRSNNGEFSNFQAITRIEVLQSVRGKLPQKIDVYHSMNIASCGVVFHMGTIELFALPKQEDGKFSTESFIEEAVNKHVLFAYFDEGKDLPLSEITDYRNSLYMDSSPCETKADNNAPYPNFCKWEDTFFGFSEAYYNKIKQLAETDMKKKWWQRFN